MVAAYRLHAIEAVIARLIRLQAGLPSVILANLVIGENVVPELIQEDCTAEKLTAALLPLISDTPARRRQIEAFGRLDGIMGIGGASPGANAAEIVLDAARRGRSPGRSGSTGGASRNGVNRRSAVALPIPSILLSRT